MLVDSPLLDPFCDVRGIFSRAGNREESRFQLLKPLQADKIDSIARSYTATMEQKLGMLPNSFYTRFENGSDSNETTLVPQRAGASITSA
jgi:hypothetical protein